MQGCAVSRCVHLPGPNRLRPQRERALSTPGARTGGPLLWRRMHTEVSKDPRYVTPVHDETQQNVCDLSVLSHLLLFFSSKGEECDDMNSMNGDGCSSQCKKEPFFNCIGKCCQRCDRCVCSSGRLQQNISNKQTKKS